MEKNKVKILVACHKPDTIFSNDVYTPIHVGRSISKFKNEMKDMIGDDTGDNISEKNPSYCELTALYWAWKNLHDVEYIGLCHYRRYFKQQISDNNIEQVLDGCDILLSRPVSFPFSIQAWLCRSIVAEDVFIMYSVLIKRYPEKKSVIDSFFIHENRISPCNMFVCKKELFDNYAEWMFDILFEIESYIKPSSYSRLKRVMGYLSEPMLTLFARLNSLSVREMPLVSMIGDKEEIFKQPLYRNVKNQLNFYLSKKRIMEWDYALITGLKNDGIYQKLYNE